LVDLVIQKNLPYTFTKARWDTLEKSAVMLATTKLHQKPEIYKRMSVGVLQAHPSEG